MWINLTGGSSTVPKQEELFRYRNSNDHNMSDFEKTLDIIIGRWRSQILYAGVKVGIFDCVTSTPKSASDIAKELDLDHALTYRLLRALASIGLLNEDRIINFR